MLKRIILPFAVMFIFAACMPVAAADIKIASDDLDYFIGTYDAGQNTLIDFAITRWDNDDPMGYHNAVSEYPDDKGVFFGLAPWYTGLAQAILEFPEKNLTYVSFVDIKLSYSAHAIVTKWKNVGDSLVFICVSGNFPDLGGAPNLDGCYLLPDSSHFMIARSAGGGMESIWHRYVFLLEDGGCGWDEIYRVESDHRMFDPEYTERWCRLIDSAAPQYFLKVIERHFKAAGEKMTDGSYKHENTKTDTVMINLWDQAQKANTGSK